MIVATPIDFPKIVPDDWVLFWKIWDEQSGPLRKIKNNFDQKNASVGSSNIWVGLDVYKKLEIPTTWQAPFYDIKDLLPNMYKSFSLIDEKVYRVRLIQSTTDIIPHSDDNRNIWNIRAFFHYTSTTPQWYFTKPSVNEHKRYYLIMPEDTNWFMYNDRYSWHGSNFDPNNKKILLQFFTTTINNSDLVERSVKKYKDYTIEF